MTKICFCESCRVNTVWEKFPTEKIKVNYNDDLVNTYQCTKCGSIKGEKKNA